MGTLFGTIRSCFGIVEDPGTCQNDAFLFAETSLFDATQGEVFRLLPADRL